MRPRPLRSLALAAALASALTLAAGSAGAADDLRGTLALVVENDAFAGGTDRNYTSGLRLSYLSGPNRAPGFAHWLGERLFDAKDRHNLHAGIAIGHSIFTPQDIELEQPLPDQHPYAGYAYLSFSLLVDKQDSLDTLALDVGLIGPDAGGEWIQKNVHELIDSDEPRGWDNQLKHEPGLVLTYERKWRALAEWDLIGLGIDVTPNAGFSVGNVLTQAQAGLTLRIGNDLVADYGPPRIRPSLAGGGFFTPRDSFGWYLFAGAAGRAVAYNVFLDGNTLRDSPEVDRRPYVADFQGGLVIQLRAVQIGFTAVARSKEFETQKKDHVFGAVTLAFKL